MATHIEGKTIGDVHRNLATYLLQTNPTLAEFILSQALKAVCQREDGLVTIDGIPASVLYEEVS